MHRRAVVAVAALCALVGGSIAQVSAAQPPSPGSEALESKSDVQRAAARVEALAGKVAEAKHALTDAQLKLAAAYERVSTTQREARDAETAAESARRLAESTRREAKAAKTRLRKARGEVDSLAAASLQLGDIDSVRAYLGADSVDDALARASMLDAISASRSATLADLRHASTKKADKKAAARAALRQAVDKRNRAERAVASAKRAYEKARSREQAAEQRAAELIERKDSLRTRLERARQELAKLREKAQHATGAPEPPSVSTAVRDVTAEVVAPATGTVTSDYGPRGGSIHYGLDLANRIGTPVVSAMDGKVISSGPVSGFGRWVRVRHDNGLITVYGHIHESLVDVGQRVAAGQQIATIGNRGQSTGPHLHFEVHRSGRKINPMTWLQSHGASP